MKAWIRPIGDWWLNLRRTLTASSVTLLIVGILSLNILWGLPWVGLFSGTTSLFLLGLLANRLFKPRLAARAKTPSWVRAGQPMPIRVELSNRYWLPAMDLRVGLEDPSEAERFMVSTRPPSLVAGFSSIGTRESRSFEQTLSFPDRGVWKVPAVRIESLFPFHLFRSSSRIEVGQQIAVAPCGLDEEATPELSTLRQLLHGTRRQWFQAESLQYVGSREYQVGVPVRRWDFASWARLGKPIYREYCPPTSPEISLLLDTTTPSFGSAFTSAFRDNQQERHLRSQPSFEQLLSLAVTILEDFLDAGVGVELRVVEPSSAHDEHPLSFERVTVTPRGDLTEAMVKLANARPIRIESAESFSRLMEDNSLERPTVVVSRQRQPKVDFVHPHFVWICSETGQEGFQVDASLSLVTAGDGAKWGSV